MLLFSFEVSRPAFNPIPKEGLLNVFSAFSVSVNGVKSVTMPSNAKLKFCSIAVLYTLKFFVSSTFAISVNIVCNPEINCVTEVSNED